MRSKDQKSLVAHQTNSSRRRFATGLFVSLAGGLILRPAEAFPRGSDSLFEAATRILQRFGLSVSGAFDQVLERDVLTIDALPDPETQYDFVVNDVDAAGGIQPCVKTAFFQISRSSRTSSQTSPEASSHAQKRQWGGRAARLRSSTSIWPGASCPVRGRRLTNPPQCSSSSM
jgi:hypothetical protein